MKCIFLKDQIVFKRCTENIHKFYKKVYNKCTKECKCIIHKKSKKDTIIFNKKYIEKTKWLAGSAFEAHPAGLAPRSQV